MATEAIFSRETGAVEFVAAAALLTGQVLQLPDGRAGVVTGRGPASGETVTAATLGRFNVQKDTSVLLAGQQLWWDASANKATHSSVSGDLPIGVCVQDSTGTTVLVDLNRRTTYAIEQGVSEWEHEAINGLGVKTLGGSDKLELDGTTEVAQAALLSVDSIAVNDNPIFEAQIKISGSSGAALDISLGLANASHPTDADSITEHVFFHVDGGTLNILAQSKDGTTTVTATDTTIDYVLGTYFFVQIDARNPADVQLYVNGVNVLPATVFRLDGATGPMKCLAHVEKEINSTPADVRVKDVRAYEQQAA